METANIRIREWIQNGDTSAVLDLSNLGLNELPDLPYNLLELKCNNNNLTNIDILPENLRTLECYQNKINFLNDLPRNLKSLDCFMNELYLLDNLPDTLEYLNCGNNFLVNFVHLPQNLQVLVITNNRLTSLPEFPPHLKQLYIDNNIGLKLTPNQLYAIKNLEETDFEGTDFKENDFSDTQFNMDDSKNKELDESDDDIDYNYYQNKSNNKHVKGGYSEIESINFETQHMNLEKEQLESKQSSISGSSNSHSSSSRSSCDMLTEHGEQCVFQTEYIKTTDGESISCKNYCYKHSDKIIEALRKKYTSVKINGNECKILDTLVLLNNKNVDTYTDYQIKKLMKSDLDIFITVKTDNQLKIQDISTLEWILREEEGADVNMREKSKTESKDRWISNINWRIYGNILKINYNISYIDNIKKQSRDDIFCSKSDVIKTASKSRKLGSGSYGETSRSDNIVVKKMDIFDRNKDFVVNNLREMCFLTTYTHHFISHLKCLELILPIDIFKHESKFKMHLKYEGVALHNFKRLNPSLPECKNMDADILFVLEQLIWLLCVLEERDIIHGDLKPQNIVIDDELKPTMIDWGAVSFNSHSKMAPNGTIAFIDPISFFPEEGQAVFSTKNDIFSVGLSILYLYDRIYYTEQGLLDMYFKPKAKFSLKNISKLNNSYGNKANNNKVQLILDDMLKIDIIKRKSAKQLMSEYFPHSTVSKYKFKIREIDNIDSGYIDTIKLINIYAKPMDFSKARSVTLSWISEVVVMWNMWKCYVLCCYIFDLYCSNISDIYSNNIQLIAIACLYIATMIVYNDFNFNLDDNLVQITNGAYTKKVFSAIVIKILNSLNFNVYKTTFETPLHYSKSLNSGNEMLNKPNVNIVNAVLRELMLDSNFIGANDSVYITKFNKLMEKHPQLMIK